MTNPLIFPLILVLAATCSLMVRLTLTARWLRATAEVLSLGQPYLVAHDSRVDSTMVPTVRFTAVSGDIVMLEDKKLHLGPAVPGDHIEILYSPTDPTKVVATAFLKRFRAEVVILAVGIFLLGAVFVL
jgi:hypothetical protein